MWNKAFGACLALVCMTTSVVSESWDVSLWGKPRAFTAHVERLAELVEERSGGAFTLNLNYGGLSKNRENLDGIAAGKFEMAQFCTGYHPGKNPTLTVLELPFLGINSLTAEREISEALHAQPSVVEDLARWNARLLMPTPLPQYNIMGAGNVPSSIGDLAGLRVRATGGIARALQAVGVATVSLTASEVAGALERGDIDAVAFAPHAHMAFGVVETATWWTANLNPGTVHCPVVANTDALDALSPEHRDILLSSIDDAMDHYLAQYEGETMTRFTAELEARDIAVVRISDEERAVLFQLSSSVVVQNWIAETTALGAPAQDLFNWVLLKVEAGIGS